MQSTTATFPRRKQKLGRMFATHTTTRCYQRELRYDQSELYTDHDSKRNTEGLRLRAISST